MVPGPGEARVSSASLGAMGPRLSWVGLRAPPPLHPSPAPRPGRQEAPRAARTSRRGGPRGRS